MRRSCSSILFVLVIATFACTADAGTTYWRITADRVTVISSGNGERCARLAAEFTTFERVLRQLANWDASFELPPVALYSLSEQDARRVFLSEADRRQQVATNMQIYSKYLPGFDYNIAAIVDVGGNEDPLQSVLLLYAEGMLTYGPTRHDPPWYQLGLANLLNGLMIRSDGSVLLNRNVPFQPVDSRKGATHERYDLARLLQTRVADLNAGADFKAFITSAREWAQFGLLTTDQRRSQYRELATLIRQGAPAEEAVKDSFGMTLEQLASEFLAGSWHKEVQFRITPTDPGKLLPAPIKLESTEAETLLQVLAKRALVEPPGRT